MQIRRSYIHHGRKNNTGYRCIHGGGEKRRSRRVNATRTRQRLRAHDFCEEMKNIGEARTFILILRYIRTAPAVRSFFFSRLAHVRRVCMIIPTD